jgi:hypothetical protein
MAEKFERIFEYRVLLSKALELHIPLTGEQELRLRRLQQQLPQAVPALDDRDPYTLMPEPLHAEVVCAGRFSGCTLRNASGAGLAMTMPEPPALGQRVLVHVRDPHHSMQYTFPARVVSRVIKGTSGMSVAFEGLPSQAPSTPRSSGVFRAEDETTPTEITSAGRRRGSR